MAPVELQRSHSSRTEDSAETSDPKDRKEFQCGRGIGSWEILVEKKLVDQWFPRTNCLSHNIEA